jgi:Arc/MetJ-type ribon-helix-helix transcriptional regulator
VEEERLRERRKKFRFKSVSDFIRAAVLDDEIKVVTEVN